MFLCVLYVSQNKQRLFPYSNNLMGLMTQRECVYCVVRMEYFNIIEVTLKL